MKAGDCVASGDNLKWMVDSEKSEKMAVCHDDHAFLIGFPTWTRYDDGESTRVKFWAFPGGKNHSMDGTQWAGLTWRNLVISAYDAYRRNGYRSGHVLNFIEFASDDDGIIRGGGVQILRLVSLPNCTSGRVFSETRDYLPNAEKWTSENPGQGFEGGSYPRGEGVLTEGEMVKFGFQYSIGRLIDTSARRRVITSLISSGPLTT